MKINSKSKIRYLNEQSAFSLIEVLISLLILSFVIMGSGEMLTDSAEGYHFAQQHAEALIIASAIVDSVSIIQDAGTIQRMKQYWQHKLDNSLPGSLVTIEQQKLEDKCVYIITLSFGSTRLKNLTLKVAV